MQGTSNRRLVAVLLMMAACSDSPITPADAGRVDAGSADAGMEDSGAVDAGGSACEGAPSLRPGEPTTLDLVAGALASASPCTRGGSIGGEVGFATVEVPAATRLTVSADATAGAGARWVDLLDACAPTACLGEQRAAGLAAFVNHGVEARTVIVAVGEPTPMGGGAAIVTAELSPLAENSTCEGAILVGMDVPAVGDTTFGGADASVCAPDAEPPTFESPGGYLYYRVEVPSGHRLDAFVTPTEVLWPPSIGIVSDCSDAATCLSFAAATTATTFNLSPDPVEVVLVVGPAEPHPEAGPFELAVTTSPD